MASDQIMNAEKTIMYEALIVAAGSGSRSGLTYNKNLYVIRGKPLISYSVEKFLLDKDCKGIIIVCPEADQEDFKKNIPNDIILVTGGKTRQESVVKGLAIVTQKHVMIHDGARPNFSFESLKHLKLGLMSFDALTLAIKVKDALGKANNDLIVEDVDREQTFAIQTPQAFLSSKIKKAHQSASKSEHTYQDDTALIRSELKEQVKIIIGNDDNIKATTASDFLILEALL
jgi:2-C-methyl-D-erythritol 4-phosphate cytidylyltransferase